jgi:hypothetical protein
LVAPIEHRVHACRRRGFGETRIWPLLVSLALFALSIAAAASFLSWMRHAAPIKDDHHDSED